MLLHEHVKNDVVALWDAHNWAERYTERHIPATATTTANWVLQFFYPKALRLTSPVTLIIHDDDITISMGAFGIDRIIPDELVVFTLINELNRDFVLEKFSQEEDFFSVEIKINNLNITADLLFSLMTKIVKSSKEANRRIFSHQS